MYEIRIPRWILAIAFVAIMVFGVVASRDHQVAGANDNSGHVAIMQQSGGDDGHMQIAYGFDEGSGHLHATGRHGQICTNGINVSTTGGHVATTNDGHQFAPRPAGRFSHFGTMAPMREFRLMEITSGGSGHRLSQALLTGYVVVGTARFGESSRA